MSLPDVQGLTSSSKATTRSAAPSLLASHTRKVLSSDPLASRVLPVAGSVKVLSAHTECPPSTTSAAPPAAKSQTRTEPSSDPLREAKSASRLVLKYHQRSTAPVEHEQRLAARDRVVNTHQISTATSYSQSTCRRVREDRQRPHSEPTSITTSASPPATGSKMRTFM